MPLPVFHMRLTLSARPLRAALAAAARAALVATAGGFVTTADDADADGATAQRGASATSDADRGALEHGTVATGKTRHALLVT